MDDAINSLYENKQVNQLMENDEHFCEIIEDTDNYISYLIDLNCCQKSSYMACFCKLMAQNFPHADHKIMLLNSTEFQG